MFYLIDAYTKEVIERDSDKDYLEFIRDNDCRFYVVGKEEYKRLKESDTIHLFLKFKWYDMIASGGKKEEYRLCNSYWKSGRLINRNYPDGFIDGTFAPAKPYVTFHRGYTKETMMFDIENIIVGRGKPEWGAPTDKDVFIIKLGMRIK